MIQLTRLNGETFKLNAFMIEQIQSYPDTTITLINGKKIVVKDTEEAVTNRIITCYQKVGLTGSIYEVGEGIE